MQNSFTAIFEKIDDWYIGYVQELPGANVQEKTLEEARESLREAIELILISNHLLTRKIPNYSYSAVKLPKFFRRTAKDSKKGRK